MAQEIMGKDNWERLEYKSTRTGQGLGIGLNQGQKKQGKKVSIITGENGKLEREEILEEYDEEQREISKYFVVDKDSRTKHKERERSRITGERERGASEAEYMDFTYSGPQNKGAELQQRISIEGRKSEGREASIERKDFGEGVGVGVGPGVEIEIKKDIGSRENENDMAEGEEINVETTALPECRGCGKVIEGGNAIQFSGGVWHIECFQCTICSKLIEYKSNMLFLTDGKPICMECSYSCTLCEKQIFDEAVVTAEGAYHSDCFRCSTCKKKIQGNSFAKTNSGVIYCVPCYVMRKEKKKMLARQQEKLRGRQKELPEIPEGTKEPEVKQSSKRELGVGLRVGTDADRDQRVRSREHKDRSNVETRRLTKEIERLKEELKEAYEKIAELQTENARLKSGASITNTSSTTTVAATGNVERKNTVIKKDGKEGHVIQISKKAEMFFGGVHAHAYQGFSSLRPVRCDHCGELVWGINGKDLRCRLCTYTVHQRCLSNDTSKCTGPVQASGGRSAPGRGAEVEDNKAADASFAPDAMFTRSLEKQVELEHASDGVPWIVHKSLEFIETYGADMEGIYRKSRSTSDIRTVHNRISLLVKQRRLDEPIAPADMDVASVTSVLKQYFRDLPNPLLTSELYRSWIHASSIEVTEQEKIIWYRQVALSMPPAHFLTMLTLLRHLNKISSLSSVNLMTPVNLSVVFAPNLLRLPSNHLGLEMLDISAVNVCITFLITRVDAIWPSDSTKLPSLSFPPLPPSASNASLVSSDSAHAESSDFQPISPLSPTFPTSLSGNAFAIP